MILARLVEAPVFPNAQDSVLGTLFANVGFCGGLRGDFHDEVRRLALLGDDVAVARLVGGWVHVEGNQKVGPASSGSVRVRLSDDPAFGFHQRCVGPAEVQCQVMCAAGFVQVVVAGHLVGLAPRWIRQSEARWRFPVSWRSS